MPGPAAALRPAACRQCAALCFKGLRRDAGQACGRSASRASSAADLARKGGLPARAAAAVPTHLPHALRLPRSMRQPAAVASAAGACLGKCRALQGRGAGGDRSGLKGTAANLVRSKLPCTCAWGASAGRSACLPPPLTAWQPEAHGGAGAALPLLLLPPPDEAGPASLIACACTLDQVAELGPPKHMASL